MKLILTGGGTGGHIYPALAIASEFSRENPGTEILYVGSETGLEKEIVRKRQIPFEAIHISGFRRKLSLENVKTIIRFWQAVRKSKQIIRSFMPDVVIGTGGYVCGPVVYAASRLGIPTLIHEQNVIPGLTNRFLSRYADCVAVSFEGSEKNFPNAKKSVHTGNPRASEVVKADRDKGMESLGIPPDSKLVLVVGGSRGAKAVNEAMIEMVEFLYEMKDVHFVYVTGNPYFESTLQRIQLSSEIPHNLHIVPYLDNMPEVLAATTLIVSRSGASSLAEITALGIPSILIPSPNVTNHHQEANAKWLSDEDAAITMPEKDLSGRKLYEAIRKIVSDPIRAEHMSRQSLQLGCPDAAKRICDEIRQLTKTRNS